MPMIKRGDGSTGRIVEAVDGNDKDMCIGCGYLFPVDELTDGKCDVCETDGGVEVETQADADESCCCCEEKEDES